MKQGVMFDDYHPDVLDPLATGDLWFFFNATYLCLGKLLHCHVRVICPLPGLMPEIEKGHPTIRKYVLFLYTEK